jgi:hypothetical protein
MTRLRKLTGLVVCGYLGWAAPAAADAVTVWNDYTVQSILTAGPASRPGGSPTLDLAMVHAAIHDAVQAFERRFEPYHVHIAHDGSGSPVAAVAKAARDILVHQFPAQEGVIDARYTAFLASQTPPLLPTDPGVLVGQEAAAGIIALRNGDGSFPVPPPINTGGTGTGEWRPTPPAAAPFAGYWLAVVPPYTFDSPDQFRANPPPALTSHEYTRDYDEVKALGRQANSARTTEQTQLAQFYSDNFVGLFQRMLRGIADARITRLGDSARLFALASLSSADTAITVWDSKKHYNLWRPITAIQEGDNDGNPNTAGDATWVPLSTTPAYPDYTSGANGLSGSILTTLAMFFKDKTTFTVTSLTAPAAPKTYDRFSDMADDVVDVRIYQGIHFRFADTASWTQGTRVARHVFNHFLRPVHGR